MEKAYSPVCILKPLYAGKEYENKKIFFAVHVLKFVTAPKSCICLSIHVRRLSKASVNSSSKAS